MDWRTITVSVDAEVYLSDIKDDVLKALDNEELRAELRNRELDDFVRSEKYHVLEKLYFSPDDLYRHLCDIADCGYHEPKDSLLNKLKDLM